MRSSEQRSERSSSSLDQSQSNSELEAVQPFPPQLLVGLERATRESLPTLQPEGSVVTVNPVQVQSRHTSNIL